MTSSIDTCSTDDRGWQKHSPCYIKLVYFKQLKGLVQQGTQIHSWVKLSYPLCHAENMFPHLISSL